VFAIFVEFESHFLRPTHNVAQSMRPAVLNGFTTPQLYHKKIDIK